MIILNTTKLVEIFVLVGDFVKKLSSAPEYQAMCVPLAGYQMSKSELMAIVIFYYHSGFRCMKWYYTELFSARFQLQSFCEQYAQSVPRVDVISFLAVGIVVLI